MIALVISGVTAARAAAADRYVTTTGSSSTCTQVLPCSLVTGINSATPGDTVHVDGDGGEYLGVNTALSATGISVVGEGSQVPRILFSEAGALNAKESSVTRLRVGRAGGTGIPLSLLESTGSQLMVESGTGEGAVGLLQSTLRDSFARATTAESFAVLALYDNTLRNVTAEATAPNAIAIREVGLDNPFPGGGPCVYTGTLNAQNVIARGFGGDLRSSGTAACPAPIEIGHSNFRPLNVGVEGAGGAIVDLGGNQTATEPLLAPDGFHQLPGSPTIDAGIVTPQNGPTDIDGEPRAQGAAPDIGADEAVPPPAPTPSPAATPDTTAPVGSMLRFTPRRFRPTRKRAPSIAGASAKTRRKRSPRTSRVSYRLSEDAAVGWTVYRYVVGFEKTFGKAKHCMVGKRARRLGKAKKCKKLVRVKGGFTQKGMKGANRFRFTGYIGGRHLQPGAYRMVGVPTDAAGNRGRRFGGSFAIVKMEAEG